MRIFNLDLSKLNGASVKIIENIAFIILIKYKMN